MRLSKLDGSMAFRRSVSTRGANSPRRSSIYGLTRTASCSTSGPGKPTDNAYVESFNATVRLECLGRHWFLDLDDAREKVEEWRAEYNEVRPHSAIGDRTPSSLIHPPRQHVEAFTRPEILT
jgi:putative transposase